MSKDSSVIIVGAGLSGLYCAWKLHQQKINVTVLEARERCGGRILCAAPDKKTTDQIDLGPAWLWPMFQPRLEQLMTELNIETFPQYTQGDMIYEVNPQKIQRHGGPSSHQQSFRIKNGNDTLIKSLLQQLPENTVQLNTRVTQIKESPLQINAVQANTDVNYSADKIILAMPLRLANDAIEFIPPLDNATQQMWQNTPTWMAGHCKIVFIYSRAFWRTQGLSGEAFSHHGPLAEIYDGSPASEEYYALTSFVSLNAAQRKQLTLDELKSASIKQLQRLYGDQAAQAEHIYIQDWSTEEFTCTAMDLLQAPRHPEVPETFPREIWSGKVLLAGTEVAREHGGYLEGAIESVDDILPMV